MSWVKQGGEGEGWYWVDDGTGNPAVAGDNATSYAGGAGGLLGTTGGGWTLPGKGQWNNQPYEYGPSDWRGIPFSQRDLQGNMLSKYQNAVDQLQAARQPISIGQPFARWAFGGGGGSGSGGSDWRWPGGTGNPPIAVDPSFPGVPPPTLPPDNGFGPTTPTPATTGRSWQSFTFANPSSGFERNFNYLAGIDPMLAFSYGLSPQAQPNVVKRAVDAYTGSNIGNVLTNQFNEPVPGSAQWNALGMAQGWTPPKASVDWSIDATGKGLTYGGKNYTLPWADTAYIPQTPWWQGGTTPMTSAPDTGAGSDAWWSAVLGK